MNKRFTDVECDISQQESGRQSKRELRILGAQRRAGRAKMARRAAFGAILTVIVLAAIYTAMKNQPIESRSGTLSTGSIPNAPIHWHPRLAIMINGQEQVIPPNMGISGVHHPIHTHEDEGVLHYENNFPTAENMRLKYFFESVWFKKFSSECIFDYCNTGNSTVKMYVNGKENLEFENYIPADGDDIRIEFM